MDELMGPLPSGLMGGGLPEPDAPVIRTMEEDEAEASAARKALVAKKLAEVKRWEAKHKDAFDKMKRDTKFVADAKQAQWGQKGSDKYVANITHRTIQQKVASLYARNPRVRAKRKPSVDSVLWDGRQETLMAAQQTLTMMTQMTQAVGAASLGAPGAIQPPQPAAAPMMDPMTAQMIVEEAVKVRQKRDMIDKVGKTGEILFHHFIDAGRPGFKPQMKQAIRRASTCSVAWVKIGFEREYDGYRPETETKIRDATDRLASLQAALHGIEDGKLDSSDPEIENINLQIKSLLAEPDMIVKEGLVFDFPRAWDVIPDCEARQPVGLIGLRQLAHKHMSTPEQVKASFGVDLGDSFTSYQPPPGEAQWVRSNGAGGDDKGLAVWYEIYDSVTGLVYTVCDGYPDFLCEPKPPDVKVDQFFPFYPVVLNEVENGEDEFYPPSDVDLIRHQQLELNRSREALRQHRIAAQPYTVMGQGKLSEEDKDRLRNRVGHEVVELMALATGQKATDIFQAGPVAPIDPNLYVDQQIMADLLRVSGAQEANLGPTSSSTATEAGIAESSRAQTVTSNVDDINEVMSLIARDSFEIMLREMSPDQVRRIAGEGAVWPETSGDDYSALLYLDIVAGSMGKPNRAQDAANFERIMPLLVQIPGIQPTFLAKRGVELLGDDIDIDDALLDGIPSVLALNTMAKTMMAPPAPGGEGPGEAQPSTGNPETDPGQQGGQGAVNMPQGMGVPGGPQAGFPAPNELTM